MSNKPLRPDIFRTLYEQCLDMYSGTPHITILTCYPGVSLPSQFYDYEYLTLNIRPAAVTGWYCDDEALSFSTRFSGVPYNVYLPFGSITAVEDKGTKTQWILPEEKIYADILNGLVDPKVDIQEDTAIQVKVREYPSYLKLVVSNDNPMPSDKPKAKLTLVV